MTPDRLQSPLTGAPGSAARKGRPRIPPVAEQAGIALITAMLIAALTTAGAVAIAFTQQLETRRIGNVQTADRAQFRVTEVENRARDILSEDLKRGRYDSENEAWRSATLEYTAGETSVRGRLRDLQGLLNLTSLSTSPEHWRGENTSLSAGQPTNASESDALDNDKVTPTSAEAHGNTQTVPQQMESTGPPQFGNSRSSPQQVPATVNVYTHGGMERILLEARKRGRRPSRTGVAENVVSSTGSTTVQTASPEDAATTVPETLSNPNDRPETPQAIAEMRLRLLFKTLSLDPVAVQAILDWIDADTDTRFPNGAEDDYYTELQPAYRAANRPLVSKRELLLVKGITPEIYSKLAPFLVCLPRPTPINVNTAPLEILASLASTFDEATARTLVRIRETQPFMSLDALLAHPGIRARQLSLSELSVASDYFELRSEVRDSRTEFRMTSLLERRSEKVAILQRWRTDFQNR